MVYQTLQKAVTTAFVLLFAVINPNSAADIVSVLSDFENGTAVNEYGYHWYIMDDNLDHGNTTVTNMTKNADGTYDFLPTAGKGNTGSGGTPGYGAKMVFKLGSVNPSDDWGASWGSMITIGTRLAPDGEYMDLTSAEKIEFWVKVERPEGTMAAVDLRVEVCTEELKADNGYYHIILPLTGTWTKYTIPLDTVDRGFGRLVQWDWSVTNNGAKPFNIKKISQVQWCISEDGNVLAWKDASGVLYLDDITISPSIHSFDDIETNKIGPPGATGLPETALLCNYNTSMKNGLGYYSFCFTDIDANPIAGNSSVITAGAVLDVVTSNYVLEASEGGMNSTKCAQILFQLGTTITQATDTVQPFLGIGTNLVATDLSGFPLDFRDLSSIVTVYFDYKLQSTAVNSVQFEFCTDQAFGNPMALYHVKCPNTGGIWKSARVELLSSAAELVLPKWDDVVQIPLDRTKAVKFKWKVQGPSGSTGTLAIDNVYILNDGTKEIRFGNKPAIKSAFNVKQFYNLAQVSFALPQSVSNARVALVSMQGKVLGSQSVKRNGGSEYQVAFPTSRLANGSYFVKVNYDNKDVKSSMISIIR
jgi:hypothetical protein